MANVAKVILIGNLTRDPQLTYTPNTNTPICDFGMAMNHRGKAGPDAQPREEVCFIDVRAFNKQAELINQYVKKGQQIYIEGRLTFEQWTGQDGQKRSKHKVLVENFQFLGGRGDGEGGGGGAPAAERSGGYQRGGSGGGGGGYQRGGAGGGGGYQRGNAGPGPGGSRGGGPGGGAPARQAPPPQQAPDDGYDDAPPDMDNAGPSEDKIPF
jgi:single-strand DNA-binding protein